MADVMPVARSPIAPGLPEVVVHGWAVSGRHSNAGLTLTDSSPLAKVGVKAGWDGPMAEVVGVLLGRTAHRSWDPATSVREMLLVGSGPGEWLVLAPPGQQGLVVDWLERTAAQADELVSVVDLTHGRALIRLTGARSPDLLAKECSVDLEDGVCPNGSALRSAVAGVATDLVRDDLGRLPLSHVGRLPLSHVGSRDPASRPAAGTRSYLLHCERSAGQYLFDSLLDAGGEFGVEVDGFGAPDVQPE